MTISLHHGAVPDGFTIGCDPASSPADGPDLNLSWDTKYPSASFWSLAASAGAIIIDASSKAIEAGARACYDAARKTKDGIAEVNRHEIQYECTLLPEGEGSFAISIFHRDAAKQKEVDRQFENSMAQLRVKKKPSNEPPRHPRLTDRHARAIGVPGDQAPPHPAASLPARPAPSWAMPTTLTRRRYPERPDCWHIYYGDVHVGTIAPTGCPADVDQWEWRCGFYPGIEPGGHQSDTAVDFNHARADFEAAWRAILPTLTDADFERWRYQRDAAVWKYRMWDAGMKLPTQLPSGRSRCYCGASIDIARVTEHVRAAHSFKVDA